MKMTMKPDGQRKGIASIEFLLFIPNPDGIYLAGVLDRARSKRANIGKRREGAAEEAVLITGTPPH